MRLVLLWALVAGAQAKPDRTWNAHPNRTVPSWWPEFLLRYSVTKEWQAWILNHTQSADWHSDHMDCPPWFPNECHCFLYAIGDVELLQLFMHPDCGMPPTEVVEDQVALSAPGHSVHDDSHLQYTDSHGQEQVWCPQSAGNDAAMLWGQCSTDCPMPRALDYSADCEIGEFGGVNHQFLGTFREAYHESGELHWVFLFGSTALVLGALFRVYFPSWLPYTVGLLVISLLVGLLAQGLMQGEQCPSRAFLYAGHDHLVTREVWNRYLGVGTVPHSICWVDRKKDFAAAHDNAQLLDAGGPIVCGHGTPDAAGCKWSWDDLYKPSVITHMHPEENWFARVSEHAKEHHSEPGSDDSDGTSEEHHDAHRERRDRRRASGLHEEVLTADELWTFECNWLRDVIGVVDMDPHVFLMVFLPPLLFESAAFGIDMGILRKQVWQILLMAFPAMLVASVLTALLVWACEPTFNFWDCWLIGTIVSATDPVAVVALLKDLGAPKELGTLIEGESLLNDGSAVVLFTWIFNTIGYAYDVKPPWWMEQPFGSRYIGIELCRILAQMLVLGILLGVVFGFITSHMLKRSFNDVFVEAGILIGMPYFLFWLAEQAMGSSAVLAVVVMGFWINAHKSSISPRCLHFLHEMYEVIGYVANTLVFTMAGAKLGTMLIDESHHLILHRSLMWSIYPIVLVTRAAAIALHYPLLKRLGTGCDWRAAVVMWWGGLRGSVGLALALAVGHTTYSQNVWNGDSFEDKDWRLPCRDIPQSVEMSTLMVVFLTVTINGTTMAPLMKFLKMTEVPAQRRFMKRKAQDKIAAKTQKQVEEGMKLDHLSKVDWSKVHTMVKMVPNEVEDELDTTRACLLASINVERASYEHAFTSGLLASQPFLALEDFVSDASAACGQARTSTEIPSIYDKHFASFRKHLEARLEDRWLDRFWSKAKLRRVAFAFQTAWAYVDARKHAAHAYPEEASARRTVNTASRENVAKISQIMANLEERDPELVMLAQTRLTCRKLLTMQYDAVQHLLHEGELMDLDAAVMSKELDRKLYNCTVRFEDAVEWETLARETRSGLTKSEPASQRSEVEVSVA